MTVGVNFDVGKIVTKFRLEIFAGCTIQTLSSSNILERGCNVRTRVAGGFGLALNDIRCWRGNSRGQHWTSHVFDPAILTRLMAWHEWFFLRTA